MKIKFVIVILIFCSYLFSCWLPPYDEQSFNSALLEEDLVLENTIGPVSGFDKNEAESIFLLPSKTRDINSAYLINRKAEDLNISLIEKTSAWKITGITQYNNIESLAGIPEYFIEPLFSQDNIVSPLLCYIPFSSDKNYSLETLHWDVDQQKFIRKSAPDLREFFNLQLLYFPRILGASFSLCYPPEIESYTAMLLGYYPPLPNLIDSFLFSIDDNSSADLGLSYLESFPQIQDQSWESGNLVFNLKETINAFFSFQDNTLKSSFFWDCRNPQEGLNQIKIKGRMLCLLSSGHILSRENDILYLYNHSGNLLNQINTGNLSFNYEYAFAKGDERCLFSQKIIRQIDFNTYALTFRVFSLKTSELLNLE